MTYALFAQNNLDTVRSRLLDQATPDYRIGECFAKHCLGQAHCANNDTDEYTDQDWFNLDYCQGWHIRLWSDGHADAFTHGFLLENLFGEEAQDGDPVLVDALFTRHYHQGYTPYWVPVQRWSPPALGRFFDGLEDDDDRAVWPLTEGRTELTSRWGYQRALRQAEAVLGLAIKS